MYSYEFENRGPYVKVIRNDFKKILVGVKNGYWAVCVKDYQTFNELLTSKYYPAIEKRLDEEAIGKIYDRSKGAFWQWATSNLPRRYGFSRAFTEGRSDGWLALDETKWYVRKVELDEESPDFPFEIRQSTTGIYFVAVNKRTGETVIDLGRMAKSRAHVEVSKLNARCVAIEKWKGGHSEIQHVTQSHEAENWIEENIPQEEENDYFINDDICEAFAIRERFYNMAFEAVSGMDYYRRVFLSELKKEAGLSHRPGLTRWML